MNPRLLLFYTACLALAASPARAQFDFGKLTKAIDKAKTITDTAKDASKVAKGAAGIGPEEEKVIGDSVALEVIAKFGGLVRDEEVSHRVNLVGRALARYSDRPGLSWRFGVLASDTVNAFSAPDGYVFITRGLYDLAASDDQLAGILGHEIAHITRKHALNIVRRDEFFAGSKSLLEKYSGDYRQANAAVGQVDAQLQQFDVGVGKITAGLIEKGFDQPTEYAADQAGHNLAALTGYAPGGLRSVLVQLQQPGGQAKKTFSTHPPLKERIKRLPDEPAAAPSQPAP
jgi:predicted Zn-dependent protease